MNQNVKQLTYYQTMIFLYKIDELKNNNKYFNDDIVLNFEDYVLEKTREIASMSRIKLKIMPHLGLYSISESLFYYLKQLTGVDPLDKEIYNYYLPKIKKIEEEALKYLINESEQYMKRKRSI